MHTDARVGEGNELMIVGQLPDGEHGHQVSGTQLVFPLQDGVHELSCFNESFHDAVRLSRVDQIHRPLGRSLMVGLMADGHVALIIVVVGQQFGDDLLIPDEDGFDQSFPARPQDGLHRVLVLCRDHCAAGLLLALHRPLGKLRKFRISHGAASCSDRRLILNAGSMPSFLWEAVRFFRPSCAFPAASDADRHHWRSLSATPSGLFLRSELMMKLQDLQQHLVPVAGQRFVGISELRGRLAMASSTPAWAISGQSSG